MGLWFDQRVKEANKSVKNATAFETYCVLNRTMTIMCYGTVYRLLMYGTVLRLMTLTMLCTVAMSVLGRYLLKQRKLDDAEKLLKEALDMERCACPDNKARIANSELSSCL